MNHTLRVLLMQLPVPNNPTLNTPLATGYLKAYAAAQGLLEVVDIDFIPRHLADFAGDAMIVAAIVDHAPDLLGVSLYTWNSERSMGIIERAREQLPDMRVVVGGPEVQKDNLWILHHPAIDVAVLGEGEQTFVELLQLWSAPGRYADDIIPLVHEGTSAHRLAQIAGIAYRDGATLHFTPERTPLSDLSVIPSPYLADYLDLPTDGMMMVEVSRWCPYSCSFCLYGRNAGTKLGNRYFGMERVLAEIRWGRERGIRRVHFVEANLNLVPLFWPLMQALEDLNADRAMTFYAELRGEHLTEEMVVALDRANVRYVEVGLQTANQAALKASLRRTDLRKWAAGTRRLLNHGIEVYLDVILGLPDDDEQGIATTLDFIEEESLGAYDIFTLQVLPGTAVRAAADRYSLRFQERPPYYVLATDRLEYPTLRRLRQELKQGAGLDSHAVEGCPDPRLDALCRQTASDGPVRQLWLLNQALPPDFGQLAAHVDLVARWDGAEQQERLRKLLTCAIRANPSTLFDCYLLADQPPDPDELRRWRHELPYTPGYLDRVAVYRRDEPLPEHERVSPRMWVVLPWTAEVDTERYDGIAEVIWTYDLGDDLEPPLRSWAAAGGAGIWVRDRSHAKLVAWREQSSILLWNGLR